VAVISNLALSFSLSDFSSLSSRRGLVTPHQAVQGSMDRRTDSYNRQPASYERPSESYSRRESFHHRESAGGRRDDDDRHNRPRYSNEGGRYASTSDRREHAEYHRRPPSDRYDRRGGNGPSSYPSNNHTPARSSYPSRYEGRGEYTRRDRDDKDDARGMPRDRYPSKRQRLDQESYAFFFLFCLSAYFYIVDLQKKTFALETGLVESRPTTRSAKTVTTGKPETETVHGPCHIALLALLVVSDLYLPTLDPRRTRVGNPTTTLDDEQMMTMTTKATRGAVAQAE
jgi:hypothetical protein